MKRIIIGVSLLLSLSGPALACDICGCGVGNFNPFLFPHLSKNFFSLGYQYQSYRTHFNENGEEINNREYYHSYTATLQYSPCKNLQLMAVVPFQYNRQTGLEGNKSLKGIGDMILLANYKLMDFSNKETYRARQTLVAGAGIKLPTGEYKYDETNGNHVGNSNFQAGTGSTDLLLNAYYSLRYRNIGFSTGINYKINSANKDGYRFGNRMQHLTQLKYIRDIGSFSIIPSIGILSEEMQQDKQDGVKIEDNHTGGYHIQGLAGIDINTKKIAVGVRYAQPLKQQLANGHIKAMPGFNVHLSYSF